MGEWEELYRRWDELSEELKRRLREEFEALPADRLEEFFVKEPYAKKIYYEKILGRVGLEVCPQGLIDVKAERRDFWRAIYPEIYEAWFRIPSGWLYYCSATGWFYEKVDGWRALRPPALVRRLRELKPPEVITPPVEVPRIVVPPAAFYQAYPEVVERILQEGLRPMMSYDEVRRLIKSTYGWDYDERQAAGWYFNQCFKRRWPLPDWVKRYEYREDWIKKE